MLFRSTGVSGTSNVIFSNQPTLTSTIFNGSLSIETTGNISVGGNIGIAGNVSSGTWQGSPITNTYIANPNVMVSGVSGVTGGGLVALGSSITLGMADSIANTLAGYNNSGVFSDVSIGTNLNLVSGVISVPLFLAVVI